MRYFMATNGYTRADCKCCLFFKDLGYKKTCVLYGENFDSDELKPLYYSVDNKQLHDKFMEHCEHKVDTAILKNEYRKKFGIAICDYWK